MNENTRAKHLEWCKTRALADLDKGNLEDAFAGFISDIIGHPETIKISESPLMEVGMTMLMNGDSKGLRKWITDWC